MMTKILATFVCYDFSLSSIPFTTTPSRITKNTITTIDNIFYNKPLNNIMSGNLSSTYESEERAKTT